MTRLYWWLFYHPKMFSPYTPHKARHIILAYMAVPLCLIIVAVVLIGITYWPWL